MGKGAAKGAKNIAIKIGKNTFRALELATDLSTTAATKNANAIAATAPSVSKVSHQGERLHLGKKLKIGFHRWIILYKCLY